MQKETMGIRKAYNLKGKQRHIRNGLSCWETQLGEYLEDFVFLGFQEETDQW